jgi:3-oxoacyl-[acyl-carrier protein] reductase
MQAATESRVSIVTGSTKGIGREIAETLAKRGDAVVVTGRQEKTAKAVAREITSAGGQALGLSFDLEKNGDLDALIKQTVQHFGRLDTLVNNAISKNCLLSPADSSDELVTQAISTNLTNHYLLCCKAFPHLKQHRGCIVNIGSIVTQRHLLSLSLYHLIKAGLINMTHVLASEWASEEVRINTVNPGFIRTESFSDMGIPPEVVDASYQHYATYQPLRGVGMPADVAHSVKYLSSPEASFITGTTLNVDGGYSVKGVELYS